MEDKITLDRETFKALAIDTRVSILKMLDERFQLTLTDLANELGMAPSTIKEHLDKLVSAGLIRQVDRGTKWKYYRLTSKGKKILNPYEKRVWIILTASILALFAAVYSLLSRLQLLVRPLASSDIIAGEAKEKAVNEATGILGTGSVMQAAEGEGSNLLEHMTTTIARMSEAAEDKMDYVSKAAGGALESVPDSTWNATEKIAGNVTTTLAQIPENPGGIPYAELMVVILLVLTVGICVGYLIRKKRIL